MKLWLFHDSSYFRKKYDESRLQFFQTWNLTLIKQLKDGKIMHLRFPFFSQFFRKYSFFLKRLIFFLKTVNHRMRTRQIPIIKNELFRKFLPYLPTFIRGLFVDTAGYLIDLKNWFKQKTKFRYLWHRLFKGVPFWASYILRFL